MTAERLMETDSSSLLAVPAAMVAVVCGLVLAVLAPKLDGEVRVAIVIAGIVVGVVALVVAGYFLGRVVTRGGTR